MPLLNGVGQFNISNASSINEVWDITNNYTPTSYSNDDSNTEFSFKTSLGQIKIFQAVSYSDCYTPTIVSNSSV